MASQGELSSSAFAPLLWRGYFKQLFVYFTYLFISISPNTIQSTITSEIPAYKNANSSSSFDFIFIFIYLLI